MTPRKLAERLERDGIEAFAPVVESVTPRMHRAALRLLGRRAEAEDAVRRRGEERMPATRASCEVEPTTRTRAVGVSIDVTDLPPG